MRKIFFAFLLLCGFVSPAFAYNYLTDADCLFAMDFEESSGNPTSKCGSATTGTNSNITYNSTGKFGKAYTYDGSSSSTNWGDVTFMDGKTTLTMCVEYKSSSAGTDQIIFWKDNAAALLWKKTTLLEGALFTGSYNSYSSSDFFTNDGAWHQYCVTYDGSNIHRYADQTETGTAKAATGGIANSADSLYVGSFAAGYYYNGLLDNLIVLGRVLSTAEMLDMSTNGLAPASPTYRKKIMALTGLEKEVSVILPVGDSITKGEAGSGTGWGYRKTLQDDVGSNFRIVGLYNSPANSLTYSTKHDGADGRTSTQVDSAINSDLASTMLTFSEQSAVLLHIGTNDVYNASADTTTIIANIRSIISKVHSFNSKINIYVALIVPSRDKGAEFTAFNTALKAAMQSDEASDLKLHIVDIESSFRNDSFSLCSGDWSTNCMADNLHPNDTGYSVMGKQWASCIQSPANTNCF